MPTGISVDAHVPAGRRVFQRVVEERSQNLAQASQVSARPDGPRVGCAGRLWQRGCFWQLLAAAPDRPAYLAYGAHPGVPDIPECDTARNAGRYRLRDSVDAQRVLLSSRAYIWLLAYGVIARSSAGSAAEVGTATAASSLRQSQAGETRPAAAR